MCVFLCLYVAIYTYKAPPLYENNERIVIRDFCYLPVSHLVSMPFTHAKGKTVFVSTRNCQVWPKDRDEDTGFEVVCYLRARKIGTPV